MNKSVVRPYLRVMLMLLIIHGGINHLIQLFVVDSPALFVATGFWVAYGSQRVFHDISQVSTLKRAFKGVIMCFFWPLIPDLRKAR
jgi:hypothetical protein